VLFAYMNYTDRELIS